MVAKEIQSLIKELRAEPVTLKLWRLPEIVHWQDAVIVTLADQAHANRPQGGSTGGYITFIALQAFQLREQIEQAKTILIWLSGDWNLSDALTKKDKGARAGLMQFLRNWMWKLSYDPSFIQSEKKSKRLGQGAVTQMRQLQSLVPWTFMDDLETFSDG
eukprot:s2000_g10.t1